MDPMGIWPLSLVFMFFVIFPKFQETFRTLDCSHYYPPISIGWIFLQGLKHEHKNRYKNMWRNICLTLVLAFIRTNFISYSTICLTRSWGNEKHMPTKKLSFCRSNTTERGKLVSSTVWSEKNCPLNQYVLSKYLHVIIYFSLYIKIDCICTYICKYIHN